MSDSGFMTKIKIKKPGGVHKLYLWVPWTFFSVAHCSFLSTHPWSSALSLPSLLPLVETCSQERICYQQLRCQWKFKLLLFPPRKTCLPVLSLIPECRCVWPVRGISDISRQRKVQEWRTASVREAGTPGLRQRSPRSSFCLHLSGKSQVTPICTYHILALMSGSLLSIGLVPLRSETTPQFIKSLCSHGPGDTIPSTLWNTMVFLIIITPNK